MNLFDLVAKLTLDSKEYENAIKDAEKKGSELSDVEARLGVDTSDFYEGIHDAETTNVKNPESPDLGLDKDDFDATVEAAEGEDVNDPNSPDLGLTKDAFDETVSVAESEDVSSPASPDLGLTKDEFESVVESAENTNVEDPNSPSLGLDDSEFKTAVEAASTTVVDDPQSPNLDLDTDEFDSKIETASGADVEDPQTPKLGLDTDDYADALKDAEDETGVFSQSIGDMFGELKGVIVASGITAAITGVVSGLSEAVSLTQSVGDSIDKQSRAMSLSADAYQSLSYALDMSGASITDLNRGLMSMRKLVAGEELTDDVAEGFAKLGLSSAVANEEIVNTEQLLMATLKALADFSGTASDRDVITQAIFGRSGTKLNALFDGTSQDLDYLINQAHELGLVMSEEEVANAASLNDAMTNFHDSIESFKTALVSEIIPIITDIVDKTAHIIGALNPRNPNNGLVDQFNAIDQSAQTSLTTIETTQAMAKVLADNLWSMGDASKLTVEQQAVWKGIAQELIDLVPSLSNVINLDTLEIDGNRESIEKNIEAWGNLAKERALAEAKQDKMTALVNKNRQSIDAQVELNIREAELYAARANAVNNVNETLARLFPNDDFRVTEEDPRAWVNYLSNVKKLDPRTNQSTYKTLNSAMSEYENALSAYESAEDAVQSYRKELEAGMEEYNTWVEALYTLFGSASEDAEKATSDVKTLTDELNGIPAEKTVKINVDTDTLTLLGFPHAKGLWDVPYDNYPALLHRDERVLTASEARQADRGQGYDIDIYTLANVVENAIRNGMDGVSVNSYLNGKDVTDNVNRSTGRQLKSRRFRG